MINSVAEFAGGGQEVQAASELQPIALRSMFWRPNWLETSGWMEHIPFAFWLVEAHRPKVIVELGTHFGVSYFAFCQAVERLGLDSRCFAVDTWKGDEHSGIYGEEVFEKVRAHNDAQYSGFSRLVRSTFEAARAHFTDGSIDLLHIDGLHTFEAVTQDFEGWLPKLSERAIVVLHDTNVRERGSGVYQLFEQLRSRYPSFEFVHGNGLGVLGVGEKQSQMMRQLYAASGQDEAQWTIRDVFARMGRSCADAFAANRQHERVRALTADMDKHKRQLDEIRQTLERTRGELESKAKDLASSQEKLAAQVEEHALERGQLAERVTFLQEVRVELKDQLGRVQGKLEAAQADVHEFSARARQESLSQVDTGVRDQVSEQLRGQVSEQVGKLADLQAELRRISGHLQEQQHRHQESIVQMTTGHQQLMGAQAASHADALARLQEQLDRAQSEASQRGEQAESDTKRRLEQKHTEMQKLVDQKQAESEQRLDQARAELTLRVQQARDAAQAESVRFDRLQAEADQRRAGQEAALAQAGQQARDALVAFERAEEQHRSEIKSLTAQLDAAKASQIEFADKHKAELDGALDARRRAETSVQVRFTETAQLTKQLIETQQLAADRTAAMQALEKQLLESNTSGAQSGASQGQLIASQAQLAARLSELESCRALLAASQAALYTHNAELADVRAQLTASQAESSELRAEHIAARDRTAQLQAQLGEILQSRSWRMTAPLRRLTRSPQATSATAVAVLPLPAPALAPAAAPSHAPAPAPVMAVVDPVLDAHSTMIMQSGLFDAAWYMRRYPDVAQAGANPVEHFLQHGVSEGRDPGAGFSTSVYLELNPDVAQAGVNPLLHYIEFGRTEGRVATRAD